MARSSEDIYFDSPTMLIYSMLMLRECVYKLILFFLLAGQGQDLFLFVTMMLRNVRATSVVLTHSFRSVGLTRTVSGVGPTLVSKALCLTKMGD